MNIVKITYQRIIKHPYIFFATLIQISISILLLIVSLSLLIRINNDMVIFNKFADTKNFYILRSANTVESDMEFIENNIYNEKIITYYEKIYNEVINDDNLNLFIHKPALFTDYKVVENKMEDSAKTSKEASAYEVLLMNENAYNFNNYELSSGNQLVDKDFNASDYIPVIVGADLAKDFTLGQKFKLLNNRYIVKGVLKRNTQTFDSTAYIGKNIDDTIIMPYHIPIKETTLYTYLDFFENLSLYNISDNDSIQKLVNRFTYENEYQLTYESVKEIQEDNRSNRFATIYGYLILGSLTFIFCLIGLIANLCSYIMKEKYNFSIMMLCGMKKKFLLLSIYIQILIPLFLGSIIGCLLSYHLNAKVDVNIYIMIILCIPLISLLLCVFPNRVLNKISITEIIGGRK